MLGSDFGRSSVPERLLVISACGFALVFVLITVFEVPGRGMGHFFYLPIILCALATSPLWGAAAGLLAFLLYWSGLVLGGVAAWHDMFSIGGGVRLLSFVGVGLVVGCFARRARQMMGDSLRVLDELLVIAGRDLATGIAGGRGFETAVNRRLAEKRPFVLLIGERAQAPRPGAPVAGGLKEEEALRAIASRLSPMLDRNDELACVSPGHFSLLLPCANQRDARDECASLERQLDDDGCRMSFGYAMFPVDGSDLLSLFRAAESRLHARMIVRGEWTPTAAGAGLVEELDQLRNLNSA